jgi:prophage antirepressor-like protein
MIPNLNTREVTMNELQALQFEDRTVRVVERDGETRWVAADVCEILGLSNPSMAVGRLDDDEGGISSIDTPSGTQEMLTVNESGLYSLIFKSRKPEARRFKKWVTSVVLPALRKTGQYAVGQDEDPLVTQARIQLEVAQRQVQLGHAIEEQRRQIEELKAQAGITVTHSTIRGFCVKHKLTLLPNEAKKVGRRLSKLCRERGLEVRKVEDAGYGQIGAYPNEVLAEWLESHRKPVA